MSAADNTCDFCGEPFADGDDVREVADASGRRVERVHGAPRHCGFDYRIMMLEQRLADALSRHLERPAAPVARVEFNRVLAQELLTVLQKWERNSAAQAEYRATADRIAIARTEGPRAMTALVGSADLAEIQRFGFAAEQRRRFASDELDRAVAVCCDALFDAVFGAEAA